MKNDASSTRHYHVKCPGLTQGTPPTRRASGKTKRRPRTERPSGSHQSAGRQTPRRRKCTTSHRSQVQLGTVLQGVHTKRRSGHRGSKPLDGTTFGNQLGSRSRGTLLRRRTARCRSTRTQLSHLSPTILTSLSGSGRLCLRLSLIHI